MKNRRKLSISVILLTVIILVQGLFPATAQATGKTVSVLGGAYKLTGVTGIFEEKTKNLNGTTISVKRYQVEKGARLTRVKNASVWGANLLELGNEAGDYSANAKVDGREDWIGDYLSNSYKSITFQGNASFRFQYETNRNYLESEEYGKGYYVLGTRMANTIIIQSGTGKGYYSAMGKAEYADFKVNGKTIKIPQYKVNYKTVYSIRDIAAAFGKGSSPFTYQVQKNKISVTPAKKSSYQADKLPGKTVKTLKEQIKLTNTVSGRTAEIFAYKINGSYCFSINDLLPLLEAGAEIRVSGGKRVTVIESYTAPLKDGTYLLKTGQTGDKAEAYQLKKTGRCWYTITNVKTGLITVVTEQGRVRQKETPAKTDNQLFRIQPFEQGGYIVRDEAGDREWWYIE